MEVTATLRYLRMSPTKVRLVANVIRGMDVGNAKDQLHFVNKKAVTPIEKLLRSAVANAIHNDGLREDNLFVKSITVDGGPALKRWSPKAFGRAAMIKRRSSHVTVVLGERVPTISKRVKKEEKTKKLNQKSHGTES